MLDQQNAGKSHQLVVDGKNENELRKRVESSIFLDALDGEQSYVEVECVMPQD